MSSIAPMAETIPVNSRWAHKPAWQTARPPAQVEQRLRFDPCLNIAAAAIVRIYLGEVPGDQRLAAGYHHSLHPRLVDACRQAIAFAIQWFGDNTAR
jgi:hypothetical protein